MQSIQTFLHQYTNFIPLKNRLADARSQLEKQTTEAEEAKRKIGELQQHVEQLKAQVIIYILFIFSSVN